MMSPPSLPASTLTFSARFSAVAGNKPYAWGRHRGLKKSFVTNCLRSTDRLQQKNLDKLIAVSGIPEDWWLHGDLPPPPRKPAPARLVESATATALPEINAQLQMNCLRALQAVHGPQFSALPVEKQIACAIALYNLMVRLAAQTGKSEQDVLSIDVTVLTEQLRLFLKMGWANPLG